MAPNLYFIIIILGIIADTETAVLVPNTSSVYDYLRSRQYNILSMYGSSSKYDDNTAPAYPTPHVSSSFLRTVNLFNSSAVIATEQSGNIVLSERDFFKNKWFFPSEVSFVDEKTWNSRKQPVYIPQKIFSGEQNNNIIPGTVHRRVHNTSLPNTSHLHHPTLTIILTQTKLSIPVFNVTSELMYYMTTSLDISMGRKQFSYLLTYDYAKFHIYIANQRRYFQTLHKFQGFLHTKLYTPIKVIKSIEYTRSVFQVIKERNYIVIYHTLCPPFDSTNVKVIIQGKEIPVQNIEALCLYFRMAVRTALEVFNYNNKFTFMEIPTEWLLTDSPYIRIENTITAVHEILNFMFTSPEHNDLIYSSTTSQNCTVFKENVIAHKIHFGIHINQNKSFCLSDVFSDYTQELFDCSYDLIAVLLHELAHFFISSCHPHNIELLTPAHNQLYVRDLSAQARRLFELAWLNESLNIGCANQ